MKLNKIISGRRKSLGITQKDLAERIGVRNATISDFEKGKYNIGSDKLELIMDELMLVVSELPDTAKAGRENIKTVNDQDASSTDEKT